MAITDVALGELERGRPFYKQRALAVLLTLSVATLIIAVVVLLPVGTTVKNWLVARGYVNETNIALVVVFDIVRWTLAQPGNESVRSVNGLVGEWIERHTRDELASRDPALHEFLRAAGENGDSIFFFAAGGSLLMSGSLAAQPPTSRRPKSG